VPITDCCDADRFIIGAAQSIDGADQSMAHHNIIIISSRVYLP